MNSPGHGAPRRAALLFLLALDLVGVGLPAPRPPSLPRVEEPPGKVSLRGTPNRLGRERSLYLRQHATNPIDWYPWGKEALARARGEDRPILLSIGYSTCHWCHVMERESFADQTIASIINASFVAIKVDREEHPELDQIYVNALILMGHEGGWPLNVFLTPDLKPFFGGTYFPPESRDGKRGFREVLITLANRWKTDRAGLVKSSERLVHDLGQVLSQPERGALDNGVFRRFEEAATRQFDAVHGGFETSPKYPPSMTIRMLLRCWLSSRDPRTLSMVTRTLDAMARGGIHDHIGGGFHRYTTDAAWQTPHFEKMIHDNALLSMAYLEGFQATGRSEYARTARRTLDYLLRDLRAPNGAFCSATDAESDGREGGFFVWTRPEIWAIFGRKAAAFCRYYNVGNSDGSPGVLHITRSLEEVAAEVRMETRELDRLLEMGRTALYTAREKRVHPMRDEKVITSWNALTISALALGFEVLRQSRYREAALRAGEYLFRRLVSDTIVYRRIAGGQRAHPGMLEDYASLANAAVDLYEISFDPVWIQRGLRVAEAMDRRFWDSSTGGYRFAEPRPDLILSAKGAEDTAWPSGQSMAVLANARLGLLTSSEHLRQRALATVEVTAGSVRSTPLDYPQLLIGLDFVLNDPLQIVVSSPACDSAGSERLLAALHRNFVPRKVVAFAGGGGMDRARRLLPLLEHRGPSSGHTQVFVCTPTACMLPVRDERSLLAALGFSTQTRGHLGANPPPHLPRPHRLR